MKIKVISEQVINGLHYKGTISFDNQTFDYVLKFGVHINELDKQEVPENDAEKMHEFAMKMFQFSLCDEKGKIEIDKEVFGFLLGLAGNTTLSLFNQPQAQANNNEGVFSDLLNPENSLSSTLGIEISLSLSSSFDVPMEDIPPALK